MHAFALATALESHNSKWTGQDLIEAIEFELEMAARGRCPSCGAQASET